MRKTTVVLLSVSIFCLLAPPVFAQDDLFDTKAAAQHVQNGIENLRAKKYDAAIAEFEESVSINPEAEAYYLLGYSYYMKGKTGDAESREKAKENFERAYELNPNFSPNKAIAPLAPPPAAAPPKQTAPAAEVKAEPSERPTGVYQGTAQPGAQATPPAAPATTTEQPKEPPQPPKEPQPPEPPKGPPPQPQEPPKAN